MRLTVDLLENNSQIQKLIIDALSPQIQSYFDRIQKNISSTIPDIVISSIKNQPEYSALLGGRLQYELGIVDPQNRINEIFDAISSGIKTTIKPIKSGGSRFNGSVKFQMVKSDFSDLLSLGSASFASEGGSSIDWLRWLLIEGDSIIVAGYHFAAGPYPSSRTGGGIMQEFESSIWRVPPEFAGSIKNNWITRGIDAATPQVQKELEKIVSTV